MNITDILVPLYKANRISNQKLYELFSKLPPLKFHELTGSELGSLASLVDHCLKVDLSWIGRIQAIAVHSAKAQAVLDEVKPEPRGTMDFSTVDEWWTKRRKADAFYEELSKNLSAEDSERVLTFAGKDGVERTMKLGIGLIYLSDHNTHHRGAIAQALDVFNIKNSPFVLNPVLTNPQYEG